MGVSICGVSHIVFLTVKEGLPDEDVESVWHSYHLPIGNGTRGEKLPQILQHKVKENFLTDRS